MLQLKDLFKLPNLISLLRIALMPFFVFFFYRDAFMPTLLVMIVIIATDFLDGFASRKLNQVTEMGKVLDPVADKICLGIGLFVILIKAEVMLWPVYALIVRDILIILSGFFLAQKKQSIPPSNLYGKLSTFFLSLSGLLFFILPFYNAKSIFYAGWAVYLTASVFILVSTVSYFLRGVQIYKALKKSL